MSFFKKIFSGNFFIITPRSHSFGGVFDTFLGIKFALYQKKKIVLAIPFFNLHPKHKKKKIYGLYLINHIFKKLDIVSKIFSILLTFLLNINLILIKLKIIRLLDIVLCLNKKKLFRYFPIYFGFYFADAWFDDYLKSQRSSNLDNTTNWRELLSISVLDFLPKTKIKSKKIIFFVKDINYHNQVAQGSENSVAEIENYRESLNLLIKENYEIQRAGDETAKKFDFYNQNYFDYTNKKINNLIYQYQSYQNSEFYFGTGGSSLTISGHFDKPRVISNARIEYLCHPNDYFSKKDIIIFKKVFCKTNQRILSFHEIFDLEIKYLQNNSNFVLIENSKEEITELTKIFLLSRNNKSINHFSMSEEFNELIKIFNKKIYKEQSGVLHSGLFKIYECNYYKVPNFFLKKYLYPNENLKKESLDLKFN
tara:strand:+ start:14383 stop:15651 length:1269 start_codon:yes stop_codon:yes gene_type:complete